MLTTSGTRKANVLIRRQFSILQIAEEIVTFVHQIVGPRSVGCKPVRWRRPHGSTDDDGAEMPAGLGPLFQHFGHEVHVSQFLSEPSGSMSCVLPIDSW